MLSPTRGEMNLRDAPGGPEFLDAPIPSAVYTGRSMNPTLHEPEIMHIVPYQGRPIRVGDVVYFQPPSEDRPIVHRVVHIGSSGIRTQGDNNAKPDDWLLQPTDIVGRVVEAWTGTRSHKIHGGRAGQCLSYCMRVRRVLDRAISPLFRPIYGAVARQALLPRLLPSWCRPQVVLFKADGRDQWRLLLGRRVIGRYDPTAGRWLIPRPFRLLVDEQLLHTPKGNTS